MGQQMYSVTEWVVRGFGGIVHMVEELTAERQPLTEDQYQRLKAYADSLDRCLECQRTNLIQ